MTDIQVASVAAPVPKTPKAVKPVKAPKAAKTEKAADVKAAHKYKRHSQLFVKAVVFTSYKRGLRNQYENQGILKIDAKGETKKCVPQRPERGTRIRAVWGKVARLQGNSGAVRARFNRNLPGRAMGHRIRIMLYPSRT